MRVIVNVGLSFDAESYEHAGRILDRVDKALKATTQGVPNVWVDMTNFQTRPCKQAQFEERAYADSPPTAMPQDMSGELSPAYR